MDGSGSISSTCYGEVNPLLGPQSRSGDRPLRIRAACSRKETAVCPISKRVFQGGYNPFRDPYTLQRPDQWLVTFGAISTIYEHREGYKNVGRNPRHVAPVPHHTLASTIVTRKMKNTNHYCHPPTTRWKTLTFFCVLSQFFRF